MTTEGIQLDYDLESLSAGVDYLTITCQSPDERERLYHAVQSVFGTLRQDADVKPWKFKGYQGLFCQGVRWGTRGDSDICMLSGYDANIAWDRFLPLGDHCTRVDLQVTSTLSTPIEDIGTMYYDWLSDHRKDLQFKNFTLFQGSDQGMTLYVGSRMSDQFGRIYDKGRQLGGAPPGKVWRFEVEFKDKRAGVVSAHLRSYCGQQEDVQKAVSERILSTVRIWFSARECPAIWEGTSDPILLDVGARVTSDEITLKWLTTQIRPSVDRLRKRGKLNQTLLALGLDNLVQEERTADG